MYGVDTDTPLTPEQLADAVDALASRIVRMGLETPAVVMLEMHKPLSFVASQAVLVGIPMLGPLLGAQAMATFSKILADRSNIDILIDRIEQMANAPDEPGPAAATGGK